jgi:multiple sugar transport system substrate-binding protein
MRRTLVTIACLLAALLLSSCGRDRGGGGAPAADGAVELRFWNGFTGPDGRTMLRLIKRFNEEHAADGVHVVMQRMPWDQYYNKLFVAGIGNRAPEVFVSHRSALQRFVGAGFVRPADDLVGDGPDQLRASDFDQNILAAARHGGVTWGIPLDVHPLGMFYNRTLLKRAGFVDAQGNAKPPATREEFVDLLRKLKPSNDVDPKKRTYGFVFTWQRTNCYTIMRQWGGEVFDPDFTRPTFASPPNAAALVWCATLIREGLVPNPQNFDAWIGFRQGRVAVAFEGIYMLPDVQKQKDLDWGAAPLPVLGSEPAAWADSHVLVMRKDLAGKELAAAKQFIRYLSDHSLDWAEGGQVPVRKSLRNSERFRAMYAQSEVAKQIPYVAYFPPTPYVFEAFRAFDDAVELALRGTKPASTALAEADKVVLPVMQRYAGWNRPSKPADASVSAGAAR